MNDKKEVFFDVYCPSCEHRKTNEQEEPCNECLTYFTNDNSHKPVNYKEKETGK